MSVKPVQPEDASTVILVRDTPEGVEVYMTRRQDSLLFLGGYHVFPGGKVDDADKSPEIRDRCSGLTPEQAMKTIGGVDEPCRAMGFMAAAVREVFEEAGVLIAADASGSLLDSPGPGLADAISGMRSDLQKDRIGLAEILSGLDLYCPLDRLLWFAHWITPATSPRRFSTFFFLARKPLGQQTAPFDQEVAEAVWIRPELALEKWRRGEWKMIPPTIASLDTLSRYQAWSQIKQDYQRPEIEQPRIVWKGF